MSKRINATSLTRTRLRAIPRQVRHDVLMFDWWVHNADRNLTELGGNPNLLWSNEQPATLTMIDHNLAFDPDFNAAEFLHLHIFSEEVPALFSDFLLRESYSARFDQAFQSWGDICDTLPEAWFFIDAEKTLPVNYPFDAVKKLLERAASEAFWQLPP
nr:HipA family kinase [Duganella sp. 1224]